MIGKVVFYNDNFDVYSIMGIDGKTYYTLENLAEKGIKINDYVKFGYYISFNDNIQTLMAVSVIKLLKDRVYKKM